MLIKALLNTVERFKSFVYGTIRLQFVDGVEGVATPRSETGHRAGRAGSGIPLWSKPPAGSILVVVPFQTEALPTPAGPSSLTSQSLFRLFACVPPVKCRPGPQIWRLAGFD